MQTLINKIIDIYNYYSPSFKFYKTNINYKIQLKIFVYLSRKLLMFWLSVRYLGVKWIDIDILIDIIEMGEY